MNKKFSTLVASMLLATTVGTVSAQNLEFTKSALPTNVRDRKSTRQNSSHGVQSRMPSSA